MGASIGSAALVLTANAQRLYAGLDAAQAKVRTFAAKAAATPVNFIGRVGRIVMPALNLAKKGITLPISIIGKGAAAVGAVGAALSAVVPYAIAAGVAVAGLGLATYGLIKFADSAAEAYKGMIGTMSFANGTMLKPEQLEGVKLALKSWENAQQSIAVMWQKIEVALAPVVTMLGELITDTLSKYEPVIMAIVDGFSEAAQIAIVFVEDVFDGFLKLINQTMAWVGEIFGVSNAFTSMGEIVRAVFKGMAKAGAYVWDTIKAGVGAVAIAIGFIVEQVFTRLVDAFHSVVSLAKELPDEIRPAWVDDFVDGVGRARDAVRNAGRGMQQWGRDQINAWGNSARAVDQWFDNLDNRRQNMMRRAQERAEAFKPVSYSAVGGMLKGSKEAWSVEARFRTEGAFQQQRIDAQQLNEQRRANALLGEVRQAVQNIRVPIFGIV